MAINPPAKVRNGADNTRGSCLSTPDRRRKIRTNLPWTRRGHRFCRYADDCNIYVRSQRAGERVMASVAKFLTTTLRLKVNESKSAVARPEERKFLGFIIASDGSERRIAPQALAKFKARIRDLTSRTRGISLHRMIETLRPYLLGWRGCFGFCQTPQRRSPQYISPSVGRHLRRTHSGRRCTTPRWARP